MKVKIDEFKNNGFKNIVLSGHSAGGWDSLTLKSNFPNDIEGVIAFHPAQSSKFANSKNPHQGWINWRNWFAGLRRSQSDTRGKLPVLQKVGQQFKLYPIIDWSNKDLHYYLKDNDLSYHPLWEQGYVSIGDWHTTQSLQEGMSEQDTRFFGLKRECGLHEFGDGI